MYYIVNMTFFPLLSPNVLMASSSGIITCGILNLFTHTMSFSSRNIASL